METMYRSGMIVDWKDDKGFGFIRPDAGGKDLFVHVKAIRGAARRPKVGDRIEYVAGVGKDGRPRAETARLLIVAPVNIMPYVAAMLCFAASVYAMVKTGFPFPLVYVVMSGVTYALYKYDKEQAQMGAYRVPEATLHFTELLGGWCGGYYAQQKLRHKTVKESYQSFFWLIVFAHIGGWGYYFWSLMQNTKA